MKRSSRPSSRPTPRAEPLCGLLLVAACSLLGCDRGAEPSSEAARPLRVQSLNVGADRPLYVGDPIVVGFDRYLDPRTATRQSAVVLDGFGALAGTPLVSYDPELRTLSILDPGQGDDFWLQADQPYTLFLGVPEPGSLSGGVRALDGGTLDPRQQPQRIAFFVRARPAELPPPSRPAPVDYCEEIQPLLTRSCGMASCHDGSAMGLDLRSAAGLRDTAVRKLARGTASGARPDGNEVVGGVGRDALLIDPGGAATSYLFTKVQAAHYGDGDSRAFCTSPARPATAGSVDVDEQERALLDAMLGGTPMPPPRSGIPPWTRAERQLFSRWLLEGAALAECSNACTD